MVLGMEMVRAVRWAGSRGHGMISLKVERKLMLMRQLGVRRSAALRRYGWQGDRALEHISICLLLIARSDIPSRRGLVRRRDATVKRIVVLIRLIRVLLLHALDGVEVVADRRAFCSRQWLFRTEKDRWTGCSRY